MPKRDFVQNLDDRTFAGKKERKGVPAMAEMSDAFQSESAAFDYLMSEGVFEKPSCDCGQECVRRANTFEYRCRPCNYSVTIFKHTLFSGSRLPLNQALMLLWAFSMGLGFTTTQQLSGVARQTASRWLAHIRQMVTEMIVQTDCRIGGEGIVVQIDESKFGKRKVAGNRRGHRVDGAWVFGGVEKGGNEFGNNKFFCTVVEDRTAETLLPLIHK
jgi:transposase-like protein